LGVNVVQGIITYKILQHKIVYKTLRNNSCMADATLHFHNADVLRSQAEKTLLSMRTQCSTCSVAPPIETGSQLHVGCALKRQSPGRGSGHATRTMHCVQSALCSVAASVLSTQHDASYTKKSTTRSKTCRPSRNKAAPLLVGHVNNWRGDLRTFVQIIVTYSLRQVANTSFCRKE
jgi:hypothetical protein